VAALFAHRQVCIQAPSADSIMAELQEPTPSGECPVLAVLIAEDSAAASTGAASTEAEVGGRRHEVMKTMKREMMSMIKQVPLAVLTMWSISVACPGFAQQSDSPSFSSPAEAAQTLLAAVQRNDAEAIAKMLGGPSELASSGDAGQDKLDREMFAQKYQEMHRLGHDADGSVTLYLGAENWPFPIPLVDKNGAWHFDPVAGLKEVLYRRIGENELTAIEICHELVAAEKKFHADPKAAIQADDPLASLASAAARGSTSAEPVLIHGYYFGVAAKGRNGFGFVAYPAEYRSSGVMTFIVTADDVVKEKDLGANSSALAGNVALPHEETGFVPSENK
jgi:hypothetical protein